MKVFFLLYMGFTLKCFGSIGIIGDSIATGAAAHPRISYDSKAMADIFEGRVRLTVSAPEIEFLRNAGVIRQSSIDSPVRLWPSRSEFYGGVEWAALHVRGIVSRQFLDTEEYSWGFILGKKLGVSSSEILIAAEDGARSHKVRDQLNRLFESGKGYLPEHIFMLFTGNDLCSLSMANITDAETYARPFYEQIHYAVSVRKGTDPLNFWLLDPIGVVQLTQSEAILGKKVKAHGKVMTCGELYNLSSHDGWGEGSPYYLHSIPQTPAMYCPSLLRNQSESAERHAKLANLIREYRSKLGDVVDKLQKDKDQGALPANVHVRQVKAPRQYLIEPDDLANDCFHLSLKGQLKLANSIFKEIQAYNFN